MVSKIKGTAKKYPNQCNQFILVRLLRELAHGREDHEKLEHIIGKSALALGEEQAPETFFQGVGGIAF
jgi:hypothetical protein